MIYKDLIDWIVELGERGLCLRSEHDWFLDGIHLTDKEFELKVPNKTVADWEVFNALKTCGRLELRHIGFSVNWDLAIEWSDGHGPTETTPLEALKKAREAYYTGTVEA